MLIIWGAGSQLQRPADAIEGLIVLFIVIVEQRQGEEKLGESKLKSIVFEWSLVPQSINKKGMKP